MGVISIIRRLNPFKVNRILEYRGKFIPQYKTPAGWCSINKQSGCEWISLEGQFEYCSYDTLEEAKSNIFKIIVHAAE